MPRKSNMVATTTADSLPFDHDRNYLMVIAEGGDLGITLGGGATFTLPEGQAWEPDLAPINEIEFTVATGVVVVG